MSTFIDNNIQPTFYQIGSSGYWYAQYAFPRPPSTGATHTISSSGPMFVEVYGFGIDDGYGYVGNISF